MIDKQLTLNELKELHGKPVWCRIPSDNPRWGIVDAESSCVVLGAYHSLAFCHYGEWKAFTSPNHEAESSEKKLREGIEKAMDHIGRGNYNRAFYCLEEVFYPEEGDK